MNLREACERAYLERLQLPWHPLDADYLTNSKTLHLEALLDDDRAPLYILRLIQWAWHNRQTGRLRLAEAALVVERVAGWRGPRGNLFAGLLESRWLDQDSDAVVVHGWEERAGKQYLKTFKDRDRKNNRPESQEQEPAPRNFHGTSTEVPTHRNRDRNKEASSSSSSSAPVENQPAGEMGGPESRESPTNRPPVERPPLAQEKGTGVGGHIPPRGEAIAPQEPTLRVVRDVAEMSEREVMVYALGNQRQDIAHQPPEPSHRYGKELDEGIRMYGSDGVLLMHANYLRSQSIIRDGKRVRLDSKDVRPHWPWDTFKKQMDKYRDGPFEPEVSEPRKGFRKKAVGNMGVETDHLPEDWEPDR